MADTVLLRFRDLFTVNTIEAVRSIIDDQGSAWWGWLKKSRETLPIEQLSALQNLISVEGAAPIYFLHSHDRTLYRASVVDVRLPDDETAVEVPDPLKVPANYRKFEFHACFLVTAIEDAPSSVIGEWAYVEVPVIPDDPHSALFRNKRVCDVEEILQRQHQSIFFLRPFDPAVHASTRVNLPAEGPPPAFVTHPIFSSSDYVLHLSDLHFGSAHEFPTADTRWRQTLESLLVSDLRHMYGDTPPAAVIVSGDLTWTGSEEEFGLARQFLSDLRSAFDLEPKHFVVIPGNHDIQWVDSDAGPPAPGTAIDNPAPTSEANYREFFERFFGAEASLFLNVGRRYVLGNYVAVDIVGLNSSRLEQKRFAGYGFVSKAQLDDAAERMLWRDPGRVRFRVVAVHHNVIPVVPQEKIAGYDEIYSFTLDAGEVLYKAAELGVDLIVHGHLHQPFGASVQRVGRRAGVAASIGVHASGSAGVERQRVGRIGKNAFTTYEFREDGVAARVRSWSEDSNQFEDDRRYEFVRADDRGLRLERVT